MEFIWFIVIGLVAGWLAGQFMKGGGFGIIGDIIVGVLGALLGGFLFGLLGVSAGGGLLGSLIVATIGAVLLILSCVSSNAPRSCPIVQPGTPRQRPARWRVPALPCTNLQMSAFRETRSPVRVDGIGRVNL